MSSLDPEVAEPDVVEPEPEDYGSCVRRLSGMYASGSGGDAQDDVGRRS